MLDRFLYTAAERRTIARAGHRGRRGAVPVSRSRPRPGTRRYVEQALTQALRERPKLTEEIGRVVIEVNDTSKIETARAVAREVIPLGVAVEILAPERP